MRTVFRPSGRREFDIPIRNTKHYLGICIPHYELTIVCQEYDDEDDSSDDEDRSLSDERSEYRENQQENDYDDDDEQNIEETL
jgi:hypothetical protein